MAKLKLSDIFIQRSGRIKLKLDFSEMKKAVNNKLVDLNQKRLYDFKLIGTIILSCFFGETFEDTDIDQAEEVLRFCICFKKGEPLPDQSIVNTIMNRFPYLIIWVKKIDLSIFESLLMLFESGEREIENLYKLDIFTDKPYPLKNDVNLVDLAQTYFSTEKRSISSVNNNQREISTRFSMQLISKLVSIIIGVYIKLFKRWNNHDRAVFGANWIYLNDKSHTICQISHILGVSRKSIYKLFKKMMTFNKVDDMVRELKEKYKEVKTKQ